MSDDLSGLSRDELEAIDRLLPDLGYEQGRLCIAGHDARALAERTGTPALVFLAGRLRDNVRAIDGAFRARFPAVRTFFALKACYLPAVVRTVVGEGAGLEVMSELELRLARAAGCADAAIVSNGVGRDAAYAAAVAGSEEVALVVVDGLEDLERVSSAAVQAGRRAPLPIGVRVTPPLTGVTRYVGASAKLGADWRGGHFEDLLEAALRAPGCRVAGLHAHQLTHAHDLETYRETLRGLARVAVEVRARHGVEFGVIDVGGGLDTRYLLRRRGLDAEDFAAVAAAELAAVGYDFELWLEPGRYVAADAAVGLTRVTAQKRGSDRAFRIVDLASNVLIPLPELAYHPLPLALAAGGWERFDVGDGTLAPSLLCRDAVLPAGPEGRTLAILNCGAYTTVFGHVWAYWLPRILLADGPEVHELVGRAEQRDVFRRLYGVDLGDP